MRLLETRTLRLHHFERSKDVPAYAILSHCWSDSEVQYNDFQDLQKASRLEGFDKLADACHRALNDLDLQWIWIDTVCIDRTSSAELSEAINSMYRWYHESQVCLVYLSDLDPPYGSSSRLVPDLHQCKWFSRGWTLQELIAPSHIRFYDRRWTLIGTKATLAHQLSQTTQIDRTILENPESVWRCPVGVRMAWAARRSTRRDEDVAYCLMGIFKVNMPIVYGEGRRAFLRLQEEILQRDTDSSLLAWKSLDDQDYRGLLARSPAEFSHFALPRPFGSLEFRREVTITNAGIRFLGPIGWTSVGQDIILPLTVTDSESEVSHMVGVYLRKCGGTYVRSSPQSICLVLVSDAVQRSAAEVCVKRDLDAGVFDQLQHDPTGSSPVAWWNKLTARGYFGNTGNPHHEVVLDAVPFEREHGDGLMPQFPGHYQDQVDSKTSSAGQDWSSVISVPEASEECFVAHGDEFAESVSELSPMARGRGGPQGEISSSNVDGDETYLFDCGVYKFPVTNHDDDVSGMVNDLTDIALDRFQGWVLSAGRSSTGGRDGARLLPEMLEKLKVEESFDEPSMELDDTTNDEGVIIVRPPEKMQASFACPFYVSDPDTNTACLTRFHLPEISDVKKHLWHDHRRPYYCPTCRLVFDTAAGRDDHIRERCCHSTLDPIPAGLTDDQLQLLARKAKPWQSAEEQWFVIWDIVFPNTAKPAQARGCSDLEIAVRVLRDFWAQIGEVAVADFVQRMGPYNGIPRDDELHELVLNQMIDKFVFAVQTREIGEDCSQTPTSALSSFWRMMSWNWK